MHSDRLETQFIQVALSRDTFKRNQDMIRSSLREEDHPSRVKPICISVHIWGYLFGREKKLLYRSWQWRHLRGRCRGCSSSHRRHPDQNRIKQGFTQSHRTIEKRPTCKCDSALKKVGSDYVFIRPSSSSICACMSAMHQWCLGKYAHTRSWRR